MGMPPTPYTPDPRRSQAWIPFNTRSEQPIVTGTSVLALTYKDGIMLAGDNLASYGSLACSAPRLSVTIPSYTIFGASGNMSDFQYLQHDLDNLIIQEEVTAQDGHQLGPKQIHKYLSQVFYARRSKMDSLWKSVLGGGFKDGKRFLLFVDLLSVTYTVLTLATCYGVYIAQPLLRKAFEGSEVRKIKEDWLHVLFYRDPRSTNQYQITTISAAGPTISPSLKLETEWSFAESIRGYGPQTQ
ncbi:N-terminal nucleophile aminohydrolase [Auriscalpium vulgare]|uniref:N-terminal nucleophile aminohydrolase n=1 Tax=Auriscalpium vulgare TaxID=40419 RepID=A0ACB8RM89_9AGAM|nr:N-terminal nucleophile aminohydrolase [Auriscalpium vulgare]